MTIGASTRRLHRLFDDDGRSFMLALDAHSFSPAPQNVDRALSLVPQMAPLVLAPSVPGTRMVHDAGDAVRVGADAVVAMTFLGAADDGQDAVQVLAAQAHAQGLPVIVESLPYSFSGKGTPGLAPETVSVAARLAEELGADLVKTRLTGTDDDKAIFDAVTVPVVALGGPKTGLKEYLEYLSRCLDLGASGVAVGRNIGDDPARWATVAALAGNTHDGKSVTDALAVYEAR